MPSVLSGLPIEAVRVLVPVYVVAGLMLVVVLLPGPGRGPLRRRLAVSALVAGAGALAGALLVWWVVDVQDVFGVAASAVIRAAAAAGGAGTALAGLAVVRGRWWRRVVAVVAVPVFLAASALMINRDVAYYPKLGDAFGDTGVGALVLSGEAGRSRSLVSWRAPADMPSSGSVGTVDIPGTESKFSARPAWVYLPPAARTAHPPRLPVMIALSGEPGGPSDVFLAGGLKAKLDALAAAHHGVAPIVVVPDQLGSYSANPMCLNSKLGDVATYITVDVRDWILRHLPVETARRGWTVAGFSEGGTCAVQFGAGYPALFGSFVAVSPELGPFTRSVARTVREGFDGSRAAYDAAQPIAVMRRTGHYRGTAAVYSVGALDTRYGKNAGILARVSEQVGMHTSYRRFPDLAHNWNTGAAGLEDGLQRLTSWWRLP